MDGITTFWTQTAVNQRNYIFNYWNKRNRSYSYTQKLNREIRKRTEQLKLQPEMSKKTNFGNTRVIIMTHYSILYKIDNQKIIITGFWDNRQDPKKLLKFLQKS